MVYCFFFASLWSFSIQLSFGVQTHRSGLGWTRYTRRRRGTCAGCAITRPSIPGSTSRSTCLPTLDTKCDRSSALTATRVSSNGLSWRRISLLAMPLKWALRPMVLPSSVSMQNSFKPPMRFFYVLAHSYQQRAMFEARLMCFRKWIHCSP